MSSKFVEFNSYGGGKSFINAADVRAVLPSYAEQKSCTEIHYGDDALLVTETPAEVVAKLQQPESAAPPAESEAVQLLERWMCWWDEDGGFSGAIALDTRALLAKLKGGKL